MYVHGMGWDRMGWYMRSCTYAYVERSAKRSKGTFPIFAIEALLALLCLLGSLCWLYILCFVSRSVLLEGRRQAKVSQVSAQKQKERPKKGRRNRPNEPSFRFLTEIVPFFLRAVYIEYWRKKRPFFSLSYQKEKKSLFSLSFSLYSFLTRPRASRVRD